MEKCGGVMAKDFALKVEVKGSSRLTFNPMLL